MAPVHHVHVLERGHVATLCCTNSRAFFVLYVRLFSFLDRSVLFSAIKMHVRQMIFSQIMNAAEYCALVKNTASWVVQPFAGAADSKWGVSHQSSCMGWTFKSISTNGANRPTRRPRVRNVWRCHWRSKGRAKTTGVSYALKPLSILPWKCENLQTLTERG